MSSPTYYSSLTGPFGHRWRGLHDDRSECGAHALYPGGGRSLYRSEGRIGSGTPGYWTAPSVMATQACDTTPPPETVAIVIPRD